MSSYIVLEGDTYDTIARRIYGEESRAESIRKANPSVVELTPGTVIFLADIVGPTVSNVSVDSENEVTLAIDGTVFHYWLDFLIQDSVDVFDTFEFTAPFEADNEVFRNTFVPASFKPVTLSIGGELKFNGVMLDVIPDSDPEKSVVSVSCYSIAATINDCTVSDASFPVEFESQTLVEIAKSLVEPNGFSVVLEGDGGPAFKRVALESNQKILDFLITLAKQRAILITNNPAGDCVLFNPVEPGNPVARLRENQAGVESVTPSIQAQQFYTDYTGIQGQSVSWNDAKYTVKNPHLIDGYRPLVFQLPDTDTGDLPTAVRAEASRLIARVVSYTLALSSWRDPDGNLWQSNTTITLVAPNAMIYEEYEFLVKSVSLDKDAEKETAELELVLPGVYSGVMPERLPWQL